jgi:hypothetical protein
LLSELPDVRQTFIHRDCSITIIGSRDIYKYEKRCFYKISQEPTIEIERSLHQNVRLIEMNRMSYRSFILNYWFSKYLLFIILIFLKILQCKIITISRDFHMIDKLWLANNHKLSCDWTSEQVHELWTELELYLNWTYYRVQV